MFNVVLFYPEDGDKWVHHKYWFMSVIMHDVLSQKTVLLKKIVDKTNS